MFVAAAIALVDFHQRLDFRIVIAPVGSGAGCRGVGHDDTAILAQILVKGLDAGLIILGALVLGEIQNPYAALREHRVAVAAGVRPAAFISIERRELARYRKQVHRLLDHPPAIFNFLSGLMVGDAEEVVAGRVERVAVSIE